MILQFHGLHFLLIVVLLFSCGQSKQQTNTQSSDTHSPEQDIAGMFPGDQAIESHPSVVFTENFESGDLDDLEAKWGYISNKDNQVIFFSDDTPHHSSGTQSLQMTATRNQNYGGELYKTFERGWDKIHLRFYTKFAQDHGNYHHFVALRGFADPLPTPQAELVNERKIISALTFSQAQPISIHTLPVRAMLHQGSGNFMLIGLRCGHGNPLKDSQMVNVPIRIMETHSSHTNLQLFLATAGYVWK